MAKCASSAMIHLERDRNSNELYGAYGHDLTWEEVVWLADWCFVRGQNFLFPHAFYYSVRGIRVDERPPDVGPNSPWWDDGYKSYADACRRLSWLNTGSKHVCETAILGNSTYLPYRAAKACFQNQRDFNYLETRHLWEDAEVANSGVRLAGMHYKAVILDSLIYLQDEAIPALREIERSGRLIVWSSSPHAKEFGNARQVSSSGELIEAIDELVTTDVSLFPPSQNIRYRHVVKGNNHYYILFNEEDSTVDTRIEVSVTGESWWLDAATGESAKASLDESVSFKPFELKLLMVIKE